MSGTNLPPVIDAAPGRLLARGREASVHELSGGRVLRRYDDGRDVSAELAVMRHVARHGVRVPAVHGVALDPRGRPTGMVLERIAGPSLVEAALAGALGAQDVGRVLARLHTRLHRVPASGLAAGRAGPPAVPGAAAAAPPDTVLHLDLHPANVLLAGDEPVVIDWAIARTGPATLDTAVTALTLTAAALAGVPADAGDVARLAVPPTFVRAVLEGYLAALPEPPTPSLDRGAQVLLLIGAQPPDVVRAALDELRGTLDPPATVRRT